MVEKPVVPSIQRSLKDFDIQLDNESVQSERGKSDASKAAFDDMKGKLNQMQHDCLYLIQSWIAEHSGNPTSSTVYSHQAQPFIKRAKEILMDKLQMTSKEVNELIPDPIFTRINTWHVRVHELVEQGYLIRETNNDNKKLGDYLKITERGMKYLYSILR